MRIFSHYGENTSLSEWSGMPLYGSPIGNLPIVFINVFIEFRFRLDTMLQEDCSNLLLFVGM